MTVSHSIFRLFPMLCMLHLGGVNNVWDLPFPLRSSREKSYCIPKIVERTQKEAKQPWPVLYSALVARGKWELWHKKESVEPDACTVFIHYKVKVTWVSWATTILKANVFCQQQSANATPERCGTAVAASVFIPFKLIERPLLLFWKFKMKILALVSFLSLKREFSAGGCCA